jgi:hypothetical protein
MELRDMPHDDLPDQGGNPMQEGILGDWQQTKVRDESFASVKKSGPFTAAQYDMPQSPSDLHTFNKEEAELTYPCPSCKGQAAYTGEDCKRCGGYGYVDVPTDGGFTEPGIDVPGDVSFQELWNIPESDWGSDIAPKQGAPAIQPNPKRPSVYELMDAGWLPHEECPKCMSSEVFLDASNPVGDVANCQSCRYRWPLQQEKKPGLPDAGVKTFAADQSGKDIEPDVEIPAETVEVIPPDEDSLTDKEAEQMGIEKKAIDVTPDFVDDAAGAVGDAAGDVGKAVGDAATSPIVDDYVLPIGGAAAGFALGGPGGAMMGYGAGKGLGDLGQGDNVLDAGLDAAPWMLGGGAIKGYQALGQGAEALGAGAGVGVGGTTAEEAAAQGATRGGLGKVMDAAKTMTLGNAAHDTLLGDNGQQQGLIGGGGMMSPQTQPMTIQDQSFYSHTAADDASSQSEIPAQDSDDPEKIDTKEKNDGERDKDLQVGPDVNDMGGTDQGPDGTFSPDSPGFAEFVRLLPKVLQYAMDPSKSSDEDPELSQLHEMLESEHPGYLNDADDEHGKRLMMVVMGQPQGGHEQAPDEGHEPHDPISLAASRLAEVTPLFAPPVPDPNSATPHPMQNKCPMGHVLDPSSQRCPQCASGNGQYQPQPTNPDFSTPQQMAVARTASGQGPITDEQKALLSEAMIAQGRQEEVPDMLLHPENYAKELAELIGQDTPPEAPDQQQPPPPPVEGPPGASPMPMGGQPGPGAGPMMAAIAKFASSVDVAADPCPLCDSHTTGYEDSDGSMRCHTCGHGWTGDQLHDDGRVSHDRHVDQHNDHFDNQVGVDAADVTHQEDHEMEQDSGHTWQDDSGQPLKVGAEYEMYSDNYDIPDMIRIEAVKPDAISYTLTGEYGLTHSTEVTQEEASIEGLHFVPSHESKPGEVGGDPNQNMEDIGRPAPGMEQSDISTPHQVMTHTKEAIFIPGLGDPQHAWQFKNGPPEPQRNEPYPTPVDCPDCNGRLHQYPTGIYCNTEGCPSSYQSFTHEGRTADFDDINDPYGPVPGNPNAYGEDMGQAFPSQGDIMCPECGGGGCEACGLSGHMNHNQGMGHPQGEGFTTPDRFGPEDANVEPIQHGQLGPVRQGAHEANWADELARMRAGLPRGRPVIEGAGDDQAAYPPQTETVADPPSFGEVELHNGLHAPVPLSPTTHEQCQQCGGHVEGNVCQGCGNFVDPGASEFGPSAGGNLEAHLAETDNGETAGEWMFEEDGEDFRTAGAKFTPMEEREFVEEQGVARNADKLVLDGTHYESKKNVPDAHFMW